MAQTKAALNIKGAERVQETRTFEKGKLELYEVEGRTLGRATFEPGWKWSTCVKPLAGTRTCESAHLGYQLSGTMKIAMDDGSEGEIRAGDFFSIPPGHDAWVVGDEKVVVVDFQGMADYAQKKEPKRESDRRH